MTEQTPTDVIDLTIPADTTSQEFSIQAIHHVRLTVTDLERSRHFYTTVLGFSVEVEPPRSFDPQASAMSALLFGGIVLRRGELRIGLRPVAAAGDTFDQDKVGLDHLSLAVATLEELRARRSLLRRQGHLARTDRRAPAVRRLRSPVPRPGQHLPGANRPDVLTSPASPAE